LVHLACPVVDDRDVLDNLVYKEPQAIQERSVHQEIVA